MATSNPGPGVSSYVNEMQLRSTYDINGKLLQILGPGQTVAYDPANVAITGGTVNGAPLLGSVPFNPANVAITGGVISGGVIAGRLITSNDPSKLRKTKLALGRVASGTGSARILCVGTSVTRGAGASGTLLSSTNYQKSYPQQLATRLAASGIPATAQTFMGDGGYQANLPTSIDGRVSLGVGWVSTAVSTRAVMGGTSLQNSSTVNNLSFAFTDRAFDTIETYAFKGANSYTVAVDGGAALATITTTGFGLLKSVTSCTLAAHTVNIARVSGTIDFTACLTYNSTVPEVLVINAGIGGSNALSSDPIGGWTYTNSGGPYDWDRTATGAAQTWGLIAPDLTIIGLTINDALQASSLAAYTTGVQTLVSAALLYGDCILIVEPPSDTAAIPLATQQQYWAIVNALAVSNNIACIDYSLRYGSRANMLTGYTDQYHPKASIYFDMATTIANAILSA